MKLVIDAKEEKNKRLTQKKHMYKQNINNLGMIETIETILEDENKHATLSKKDKIKFKKRTAT